MGAINKTTNKYEYPKIANKINKNINVLLVKKM
jgi:hypothetical protein